MKGAETDPCTRQFKLVRDTWEHELWRSVLFQAIVDADGIFEEPNTRIEQQRKVVWAEKALAWMRSRVNRIGSFVWVCDVLGLFPDSIRREMLRRCAKRVSEMREKINAENAARADAMKQARIEKNLEKARARNRLKPIATNYNLLQPDKKERKHRGRPKSDIVSVVNQYFDSGGVARQFGDGSWVLGRPEQPGTTIP